MIMNKTLVFNWVSVMILYANFVNANFKILNGKCLRVEVSKNAQVQVLAVLLSLTRYI